jgi:hypothetical protein
MPQQPSSKRHKQSDLRALMQNLISLPLYNAYSNTLTFRDSDGVGICMPLTDEPTPCAVFVFTDSEIWIVDTFSLRSAPKLITVDERGFIKSLEQAARFLSETLNVPGPYHWVAGMEGIEGRAIPLGGAFYRTCGPCMTNLVEDSGTYRIGDDASAALEPFFREIYEQCGAKRPAPAA